MRKTDNYFLDRNNDNILKTREILNELPDFCRDYFIQNRYGDCFYYGSISYYINEKRRL